METMKYSKTLGGHLPMKARKYCDISQKPIVILLDGHIVFTTKKILRTLIDRESESTVLHICKGICRNNDRFPVRVQPNKLPICQDTI